jgi:hypothetical protein
LIDDFGGAIVESIKNHNSPTNHKSRIKGRERSACRFRPYPDPDRLLVLMRGNTGSAH